MYYHSESFLTTPIGNNAIGLENRKKLLKTCHPDAIEGSYPVLRIPPLITGSLDNVRSYKSPVIASPDIMQGGSIGTKQSMPGMTATAYEYISDSGKLISSQGLESLIQLTDSALCIQHSALFVIDNHNHAFYCRYKSYLEGHLPRGSHLIHIDQHSDLNELQTSPSFPLHYAPSSLREGGPQDNSKEESPSPSGRGVGVRLATIATYTNEVLDIASFIKPAKSCGLISDYEMILTEYSLLTMPLGNYTTMSLIVDIDLDFRAPEMSITHYEQTIRQVRKLIALPQTKCVTIATSPTYIDQTRALEILRDILE